MKKLLTLIFLMTLTVTILPAQMSRNKAMSDYSLYKKSDAHKYGFNFSESGKASMSYLGAIGTFVGTAVYANQTFPTTAGVTRTSQQNAVLIAGTTVTCGLVVNGIRHMIRNRR